MTEGLFPPLPSIIKVPFQSPNWTWGEFISSLFAGKDEYHKLHNRIQEAYPDKEVMLYDRGTSALYCALKAIKSKKRAEVLTLSFTCDTVVNSIIQAGCKPVFVDVDDEGNLDFKALKKKVNRRTLAIIPVHQWGKIDYNIEKISDLCKKRRIYLIDDCANIGIGCWKYDFDFKILSFNMGKRYFGLGGGALVSSIKLENPGDSSLKDVFMRIWKIALKIKCKPLLTPLFNLLRKLGVVSREENMSLLKFVPEKINPKGLSYFQSAIINKVMKKDPRYVVYITELARAYYVHLSRIEGIRLPQFDCNYFTKFTIFVDDDRYGLSRYLAKHGIETQWTFYPIHLQQGSRKDRPKTANELWKWKDKLPQTNELWKHTLSLPMSLNTSIEDVEYVCKKISDWEENWHWQKW